MKCFSLFVSLLFLAQTGRAGTPFARNQIKGFNLTEVGVHHYDAAEFGDPKTESQIIVDKLFNLGVRHIALSPRAYMRTPTQSEVTPMTPEDGRLVERGGYLRLIEYIHSKGMTVGIRPLLFVVDEKLNPYIEVGRPLPQSGVVWWHGMIQPQNPVAWFESFRRYFDIYLPIVKLGGVEEFTIGAELHSLTVGFDNASQAYACGFPSFWVRLLGYVRNRLPGVRIMYDINFSDDKIKSGEFAQTGGEFGRWCDQLTQPQAGIVPIKPPAIGQLPLPVGEMPLFPTGGPVAMVQQADQCWNDLAYFWKDLDAIGIDFYRSLATSELVPPDSCDALVGVLKQTSDRFATEVDTCLFGISQKVGIAKELSIKDVGYRSVWQGYLDPFKFASAGGTYNECHQAASYEAIFQSFWAPQWPWFRGIVWWDASVDLDRHGTADLGFSPLGKPQTETVIQQYFK